MRGGCFQDGARPGSLQASSSPPEALGPTHPPTHSPGLRLMSCSICMKSGWLRNARVCSAEGWVGGRVGAGVGEGLVWANRTQHCVCCAFC